MQARQWWILGSQMNPLTIEPIGWLDPRDVGKSSIECSLAVIDPIGNLFEGLL